MRDQLKRAKCVIIDELTNLNRLTAQNLPINGLKGKLVSFELKEDTNTVYYGIKCTFAHFNGDPDGIKADIADHIDGPVMLAL